MNALAEAWTLWRCEKQAQRLERLGMSAEIVDYVRSGAAWGLDVGETLPAAE